MYRMYHWCEHEIDRGGGQIKVAKMKIESQRNNEKKKNKKRSKIVRLLHKHPFPPTWVLYDHRRFVFGGSPYDCLIGVDTS